MKIVLITGGSGAIGSALVPRFLDEPGTSVRLLLRADSEDHLAERLARLLRYWETPPDPKRIEVLRCDLHEPRLGLSAEKYQQLAAEITHCVHAAGNVKLNERLETALEDAVGGTARVLDLIDSARHRGVFRKLEYVSTIGVAGRLSGRVPEARLEQPRTFHNTYEEAKARAESLVLERMRAGLPASVHRPSMVVGDSATGKIIHFQVFYYLCEFLAGLVTAGRVPEADASSLDIIPCDYVARAIQVSSESEDGIGRIFHLCSGPDLAVPISELTQFLRRTFGDFGVELPVLRPLPAARLARLLPRIARRAADPLRRRLQGLPYLLDYFGQEQEFANSESSDFFASKGLALPSPDVYLPGVLDYYLRAPADHRLQATRGRMAAGSSRV